MTDHYKFVTGWRPTGLNRLETALSHGHDGRAMLRMICTGRVILQIVPEHGLIRNAIFPRGGPCLVLEDHRSKVARVMARHRVIPLLVATLTAA